MGILRQKCVQTYDTFLNSSNSSTTGFNMSYESYIQEINNESMFIDRLNSQRFI
jgi:competence transcription factor ComK